MPPSCGFLARVSADWLPSVVCAGHWRPEARSPIIWRRLLGLCGVSFQGRIRGKHMSSITEAHVRAISIDTDSEGVPHVVACRKFAPNVVLGEISGFAGAGVRSRAGDGAARLRSQPSFQPQQFGNKARKCNGTAATDSRDVRNDRPGGSQPHLVTWRRPRWQRSRSRQRAGNGNGQCAGSQRLSAAHLFHDEARGRVRPRRCRVWVLRRGPAETEGAESDAEATQTAIGANQDEDQDLPLGATMRCSLCFLTDMVIIEGPAGTSKNGSPSHPRSATGARSSSCASRATSSCDTNSSVALASASSRR